MSECEHEFVGTEYDKPCCLHCDEMLVDYQAKRIKAEKKYSREQEIEFLRLDASHARLKKENARKISDLIDADRRFKSTSNDLFTVQKKRNELQFENDRLRQIAAHVPAKIYIAAKEKAGYGTTINPAPGSGLTLRD